MQCIQPVLLFTRKLFLPPPPSLNLKLAPRPLIRGVIRTGEQAEMRAWPKMHGKYVRRPSRRNVIILSTMKNTSFYLYS